MDYTVDNGWIVQARKVLSPNFGSRVANCEVDLLVIHNISLPPGQYEGQSVERFFCNVLDWDEHPYFCEIRDMKVSAHLFVRRNGELLQFVNFADRAWHAGRSSFRGRNECNDFSIGIELEGTDNDAYTERQYRVLAGITTALIREYPTMNREKIVGHSDIAPGRKSDPGPAFDWRHYRSLLGEEELI